MTRVLVLNGPNLGRLGRRQPEIYGSLTHAGLREHLVGTGEGLGLEVEVRQTDSEAEMINWLHEAADEQLPVVINPAAWSHYSIAIADAVAQLEAPVVEVHLSNIAAREEFRHHSVVSAYVTGTIAGLGASGYDYALAHISALTDSEETRTDPAQINPGLTQGMITGRQETV
ncbi:type II 3-dehydroquinate dehydratase [Acidipropionibacterium acidipropionici]|jgi:3-dehydroquinate dehydratase-2|uniref:3-dehydroquinate dehydratase n=1 Tax=Acidipropionibacterium acidipropionici (strain ATCC 4875 / DSM 20272 / JCM 6432 / NBRC 12425 / NCIMB 8070 / 4) TaxID=1171373 RepID=K7RQ61_ACIA4|nr:3-dehydroquinate dehydratase, type II [Acidipropionibacterium acidipropionici ATCC 4875]APZ08703.1 type II 3-dehydroquinate dehydratase [Acidipropionibacterium acidipropionici]AZP37528.1 type II 3-dehydroquinate dehydratase [Acidipropionibacterium acidipropionici]QCV94574.1 type II 3-dehydroquinate dehydratase [Acidipropionibacterium acidipropionici]